MLERSRCPAVPTTLMNRLLNMYRDSGTQKLAVIRSSSMKLSRGGAADKEPRRENEDLIERLERRNDSIKDGGTRKDAEYQQEQEHQNIAADRGG